MRRRNNQRESFWTRFVKDLPFFRFSNYLLGKVRSYIDSTSVCAYVFSLLQEFAREIVIVALLTTKYKKERERHT
jgi:hypothetical protein